MQKKTMLNSKNVYFLFLFILVNLKSSMAGMPGGFGETSIAGEGEQALLMEVKPAVEGQLEKTFSEFAAEEYMTQVVAGTNYIFKVRADAGEYLHVKVHKPLPFRNAPPQLMGVLAGKAPGDALQYFE